MTKPAKAPPAEKAKEANKYDKIIKENLEGLIPALVRTVLKLEGVRLENLPQVKLQTTFEREPDFLKKMYFEDHPGGRILQIEFESKDSPETDYRMLEYLGILFRKFKKPIVQHVVYLGEKKVKNTKGELKFDNLSFQFPVHSIREISYTEFIHSNDPEEMLLSILASPNGEPPTEVIRLVIERLIQLRGNNIAVGKFIKQLEILSGLRNLQKQTTKIIDKMFIEYDITKDVRYQQGQAVGIEKGIEKGMAKGVDKGAQKKAIIGIINMTAKKFGPELIAELLQVEKEFVTSIQSQLKHKPAVFDLLKKRKYKPLTIAKRFSISPLLAEIWLESKP